ncbi:putative Signal recognition particle GTPase [groundwater metagenome]|uniref:Putative Signal recognition particle GTPase n=1 Tax=groundwater metagenome TaxID=717931 RepID=A0A098E6D4_9ZZZZ
MTTVKGAESLEEIYDIFDPMKPLEGEYLNKFYVSPYKANKQYKTLFEQLKGLMLKSMSQDKFLFGGFKGCGKSTELNRLCENKEIKDKFLVVKFSIRDKLNIADFDYKDLLMVCAAEIYNCAKENNIEINKEVLEEIEKWAFQLTVINTEKEEGGTKVETGIDLGLGFIFGRVLGWIKFGSEMRKEMRKEMEPKIPELVEHINRMLEVIKRKTNVLLVVEDIDKLYVGDAEKLFFSFASPFLQLNCKAIFTFPFALMLSPNWGIISRTFADPIILPNITIHEKGNDRKKVEENYDVVREIFKKRANRNLIDEDALDECIKYSGGVVFDFIRIIRNASNLANVKGKKKIEKDDIEAIAIRMRDDYSFLNEEHIEKLKYVYNKKELSMGKREEGNKVVMELLGTLSILKYYNSEEWFDVHPIIEYKVK